MKLSVLLAGWDLKIATTDTVPGTTIHTGIEVYINMIRSRIRRGWNPSISQYWSQHRLRVFAVCTLWQEALAALTAASLFWGQLTILKLAMCVGNHRRGRKWIDQVEKKVTLYHLGWKWAKALHDVSPIRGSLLWLKNRFVWRSSLHIKSDLSSLNQRGWSHTHSRHSQTRPGTWRLDFMHSYKPDAWIVPLIWQDCNYELMLMKSHTRLQLLALVGMWCLDNHLR